MTSSQHNAPFSTASGLELPDPASFAFYLPQFHPIPENDQWWGPGFTEWRNVAAARPRFRGHEQPRLPGELGFYDLRLDETREDQAALAAEHKIDAFCIYHYWFNGRELLDEPLKRTLETGRPDFPFFLCWANENWTRVWDGSESEVLIEQHYSAADDREHIERLLPVLQDPRYVRFQDRPMLAIWRASRLPDPRQTTQTFRNAAREAGLPGLFLLRVEAHDDPRVDPRAMGFDAAVAFQPDYFEGPQPFQETLPRRAVRRLARPNSGRRWSDLISYEALVNFATSRPPPSYPRIETVCPGWDNSPRRRLWPRIYTGSTPALYGRWVESAARAAKGSEMPALFVNAWNEWAEGAVLEPDTRQGRAYLEEHAAAMARVEGST